MKATYHPYLKRLVGFFFFFFTRKIKLTILSLKGDYLCVVFGRMTYGLYHTNSLVWTQDAQDSEYARLMIAAIYSAAIS